MEKKESPAAELFFYFFFFFFFPQLGTCRITMLCYRNKSCKTGVKFPLLPLVSSRLIGLIDRERKHERAGVYGHWIG